MSDILQWARTQGLAEPLKPSGDGDFVDVMQGALAGQVAGGLETGDVLRRSVESALGMQPRDVLATGMARELRNIQQRNQPSPEARGTFLGESLPSALGSVGGFALSGLAGGAVGLGARGAAALAGLTGFASMAGPAYYEAKARGRDDMTAWTAFLAQGAVGSTEALGSVVPGLGRLGAWFAGADRATKGSFSNALLGIVTSGAREGAQETGQGALEELVNAYVLQYPDAQRDLVEILKDRAVREGAPGAVIGVLFGGLEQAVYAGAQERAGTTLVGKSPEVQAEAQTRTTGAPVVSATPEEGAALDRLRTDLGDANTVIVEDAPEYAPAVEFGRKRGHTVRTVRAPQGFEGYFDEDTGTIFVREGMRPTDAMDVVRGHEMAHALKSRNLGEWQELRDEIAGVDSAGLAEFEAAAAARYEQTTGRKMGDDLAQEEGVSYWTQNVLSPWLRQLERNPDRLAALAVDNRTFFRKLVEAGMDVLNSFGAKFKTRRAALAQLRTELGTAGARITPEQGRALAERYMRAMSGLAGEIQTQELEAGAPNYDAAQGVDAQAQEVGGALAEGEYEMQVDQTLGAMGQTPPLLPAAPVQGVRDVFQPVSPTVQRQMQELESRDATRSKLVRNAKTGEMQFTPRLRPSEKLLGKEGTGGTMRDARFALAYHGSPHKFDRFSTSRIGTGEGSQWEGWGLYFAGAEKAAKYYRDKLFRKTKGVPSELARAAYQEAIAEGLDGDEAISRAREILQAQEVAIEPGWGDGLKKRVALKAARQGIDQHIRDQGYLYNVELAPTEDSYMLLDVPLRDQSQKVQGALAGLLKKQPFKDSFGGEFDSSITGREAYARISSALFEDWSKSIDGSRQYADKPYGMQSSQRHLRRDDRGASEALLSVGVRGLKYLDAVSRDAGGGSYNYVIFDEADVNITGRFAFALSDTLADTALGEHIEMRKAAYRDAYKGMFRKVVDYLDPVRDEMPNEYRSEMLRRSKTGQRIDNEMRPLRDAFVETMRKSGITLDEIGDFIQARGAGLRNYYMGLINERELDDGTKESIEGLSGMSNEEAARVLAAAKASGKYDAYVDLTRQYDAINKRVRDIWRESGDRTAKYVDEIEQKYSHEAALKASEEGGGAGVADPDIAWDSYYTAYRTAFDEESLEGVGSESSFAAGGQGLGVSGSPVRTPLGRVSRASNPVPFAFVDLQSAIIRAGKLEVAREIAAHVEKRNDPQFARVVSIPMRKALNPESGVVEDMPDPAWKGRPDTLAFKTEDGKVRAIIFSRKYAHLAPILKGHTLTQPVVRKVAELTRLMAGLLTRQNPAFFAVNYWRDLAQVVLAAHAKQGPDFARQVVLKQRRAIGEIYRAEFGGARSAQMQEYLDSGARMGAYGFQDYADTAKSIEATLRGGRLREAGANFLRLIERFNDIAENATRYAVYQTAREKGMSIDEAAMLAKQEIGVNFERKGEYGPALSSLYAFAGAGIQGNANALSAMATKRGAAAVATIAALGFALDQMNRAISGEDDDGELVYDNRPEWQKNASLIIELGGESALQLPMPHGWRWFFNLGRRTAAWATAGLYGASDFADLAFYEALDTVNPLGAGPVAQIASPTLLDPVVQLGSNETWTGKKIAPENLPFGAQKPDSDLYWRGTGELPIWMAQTLSEITDADDSGDGFLEVSPNTIEHFARVAFGGLGSTAVNIAENVGSLASGEVPTPKEAAIFNRFWAQNSPWAIDTRYSDARKEIESAEARYVELRKMGEGQRALEWRRANITLFKAIGALKATERSLSNLPNTPANEERRRTVKARFNRKLHEIKSSQA